MRFGRPFTLIHGGQTPPTITTHYGHRLHVLPHRNGDLSALVAVDADFEIIILKNSLELIERVNTLWSEYVQSGTASVSVDTTGLTTPPSFPEYFDYVGWKQLVADGWGKTKNLEAVKIVVPKGHFLWFRTWLMHAGAEFNPDQGDGGIRLHYYLLNYLSPEGPPTSINMQANPLQVGGGCLE